ncbi:alpha-E domain-containing protein [Micromonospora craterilacus]|uniref:alpha-E domain-containing protein n=1 Tax=Micromonospora craterilacus TaxID=1655439 RepID=UPI002D791946|nr:alpha-E domain-containing protein [Micromonospora craterilacus]
MRRVGNVPAYLSRFLDDQHAAEFLLLDRLFPRSVFAALSAAESCLHELERSGGSGPGKGRTGVVTDAQRIIGRARTNLEFRGADELIGDLGTVLDGLQRTCSQVNDAVTLRYFRQTSAVSWVPEAVA